MLLLTLAKYCINCICIGCTFQDPSDLLQLVKRDPADQRYYCTLCDKFSHTTAHHTRNHVESQHFPNTFSYPCDQCDSVFSTKCSFSMHKSRKHRKWKFQQNSLFLRPIILRPFWAVLVCEERSWAEQALLHFVWKIFSQISCYGQKPCGVSAFPKHFQLSLWSLWRCVDKQEQFHAAQV